MGGKRLQRLLLGLVVAPLLTGCAGAALLGAGAAAGAGTYAYMEGEASRAMNGGFEQVWNSTLSATRQMNLQVLNTQRDALGGTIEAKSTADGDNVTIKVEPVDSDTTRVKVRVGVLGDEEESRRILQQIETRVASR